MISYTDEDYNETKRLKKGKEKLSPALQRLADWIHKKYDVRVLNIRLEHPELMNRPRLQIVLQYRAEAQSFNEPDTINYDANKQQAIAHAYERICNPREDCSNLLVIFTAFAPVARKEANMAIPEEELQALKEGLDLEELWKISRYFCTAYFMLYTDRQVEKFESNGMKEQLSHTYFKLLKPHDEFDYINLRTFVINLGSKEDFDNHYDSSWYWFYH